MASLTEVKIFSKPKKVIKALAREIVKIFQESPQKTYHIVLSGGSTPKELYVLLAEKYSDTIPWKRIHFWWSDERCVPPDNDDSNFKMANDVLFSKVPVDPENIHRIKGENPPEMEAANYAAEIDKFVNQRDGIPVFDIVLLGVGEDGHTASIFPGQLEIFSEKRNCVVTKNPKGNKRITLTGKVLNNANRAFILVTGEKKSARISEIMNNEESASLLPAFHIVPQNGSLVWYMDEKAASKIN